MTKTTIGKAKSDIQVPDMLPNNLVVYHAYVISNNYGIRIPVVDEVYCKIVKAHFVNSAIYFPGHGRQILDYCRDKKRADIKSEAKRLFPSMFRWGSGPNPINFPEELNSFGVLDTDVISKLSEMANDRRADLVGQNLDEFAETLKEKVKMLDNNNNVVEGAATVSPISQTNNSVDLSELTLDNYKAMTGKRFRLSKNEKALVDSGQYTREQIFEIRKREGNLEG